VALNPNHGKNKRPVERKDAAFCSKNVRGKLKHCRRGSDECVRFQSRPSHDRSVTRTAAERVWDSKGCERGISGDEVAQRSLQRTDLRWEGVEVAFSYLNDSQDRPEKRS